MEKYTSYKKATEDYNTRLLPKSTNKVEYIKKESVENKEDSKLKGREKKLIRKRKQGEQYKMYVPNMGPLNSGTFKKGGEVKS